jgi:hypothetical protein
MIEKYSCYQFKVVKEAEKTFNYEIYGEGCPPYDDGVIESQDSFDSEQEARYAAIGHISLLEEGPQND